MNGFNKWPIIAGFVMIFCAFTLGSRNSSQTTEYQEFCRVSGGLRLNPSDFAAYSCATCYRHMDESLFSNGTKLEWRGKWLRNRQTNEFYEPSYENASSPIFDTFRTAKLKQLWIDCCRAAIECCTAMRTTPPPLDSGLCPRTWDGWNCWKDTSSGMKIQEKCPSYIYFHSDKPHCTLACKLKALDSSPSRLRKGLPRVGGSSSSTKDVNILPNNQILPSCGGAKPIPLDQMKCNILKSKVNEEQLKNSDKGAVMETDEDNQQYTCIIEKIHQSTVLSSCDTSKNENSCDTCSKSKLVFPVDKESLKSHISPVRPTKSIIIEESVHVISPWHVSSPKDKFILLTTEV